MEAKDFEFYSIGQYHDLVMSGDGAIFELNESRAMINKIGRASCRERV